jgi:large subunit ribosomal protein L29
METDKIRNLTSDELVQQEKESMDQLFRLKFQMKMGQTESLNKIRGLRKDIARMKTIARQRELEGTQSLAARPAPKAVAKKAVRKKAVTKKAVTKKVVKKLEKK